MLGQLATISYITFCIFTKIWLMLLLAPFVVYPFAWSGHYFFEKNKPAAFKNPLYAKAADFIMLTQWIKGEIER